MEERKSPTLRAGGRTSPSASIEGLMAEGMAKKIKEYGR